MNTAKKTIFKRVGLLLLSLLPVFLIWAYLTPHQYQSAIMMEPIDNKQTLNLTLIGTYFRELPLDIYVGIGCIISFIAGFIIFLVGLFARSSDV